MSQNKPRVIKDFNKLEPELQEQIKLVYPYGFSDHLITFTNKDGLLVSALPFETDDKYYLLRMTEKEAIKIIEMDEDYDEEGNLKQGVKDEYEDKYADLDYLSDNISDEEDEPADDRYNPDDYEE
ncbi:MAG TPA: hypothetical protein DCQ26_17750 [Marinilabiliales bacterium]|jgi:hypothetical protein|nr:hypothetical protein [Salinivirgaceae bacterium]OFX38610.1 MAG: hypothetical protein A2W95_09615 [Bacteroidetes bacterium GWA2_40_14]OFX60519.1 MAG: hypothetical protein A2W84_05410 [Bacteroidetes bacterium GWC2_40_13]OFX72902.1 MAG: hypothetical protein A2W96_04665 [Bacteroidetes bacterium GWD2_40_43]OFX91565.1 MAG: hypothetical protein A2W97_05065 [Bacteroidetes bacterium GWE2_40_63]OFY19727.1 MAG: hypothetical protein A2W88_02955 [Bacteroidetes bacterium GWF2_40_13]OFZ25432.1 MAG: hypot